MHKPGTSRFSAVLLATFLLPVWCTCAVGGEVYASDAPSSTWLSFFKCCVPTDTDPAEGQPTCPMSNENGAPGDSAPCESPEKDTCQYRHLSTVTARDDAVTVLPDRARQLPVMIPASALPRSMWPHTLFEGRARPWAPDDLRVPRDQCARTLLAQKCLLTL